MCLQQSNRRLQDEYKAVERQVCDEADRIKSEVEHDADKLIQKLSINKERQKKDIDIVAETVRAQLVRVRSTASHIKVASTS